MNAEYIKRKEYHRQRYLRRKNDPIDHAKILAIARATYHKRKAEVGTSYQRHVLVRRQMNKKKYWANPEHYREIGKRFYHRHREERLTFNRERRAELFEFIRKLKNIPCGDCGKIYPQCAMEFDHRIPRNGARTVVNLRKSVQSILEEVEKCDIVCANCHKIRTWMRRHGYDPCG